MSKRFSPTLVLFLLHVFILGYAILTTAINCFYAPLWVNIASGAVFIIIVGLPLLITIDNTPREE